MIEKELFYKIADQNFRVFEIVNETDVEHLFSLYPDKEKIREELKSKLCVPCSDVKLPEKITVELYLLLTEFCLKNQISLLETCALFRVVSDVLDLFKKNLSQKDIYEQFKKSVLTFSMNRFSYQIGILKKETVYLITNFLHPEGHYDVILYFLPQKTILEGRERNQLRIEKEGKNRISFLSLLLIKLYMYF